MALKLVEASDLAKPVIPRRVSKKRHIYEMLLSRIRDRSLPVGTRLPSATELASEWQVAYATVHAALNELTRDGWLVRSPKQGTFVSSPPKVTSATLAKTAVVVLPPQADIVSSGNGDEVFEMLQGLTQGAQSVGWQIRIEGVSSQPAEINRKRFMESLQSASTAIFIGSTQYSTLIQELSDRRFPTMTLFGDPGHGNAVTYDRPAAVRIGLEHLIKKGCRRIGYVGNTMEVGPRGKLTAYRQVMEEYGLEVCKRRIGHCASHAKAAGLIRAFLETAPDADALLVANYRFATLLAQEARHRNLRIPEELGLMAIGTQGHHLDEFPLSYVRIPFFEFGIEAMKWLAAQGDLSSEQDREVLVLKPTLVQQAST